jgi:thiol-disulfide isomerase/thioredoxin/Flp pilus assembly protein TadD
MRSAQACFIAFLVVSTASTAAVQAAPKVDAERLRALFFQRDFETAVIEGTRAAVLASGRSDAKAWYLLNLAQSGQDLKALDLAQQLTRQKPKDGWSWFALAGAFTSLNQEPGDAEKHATDACAAAERARALLPQNADAIWMQAKSLATDEKRRDEAIALVDRERPHVRNAAELLAVKGEALYAQSAGAVRDQSKVDAALATFEEARRLAPTNLNAWFLPGRLLNSLRRSDEACPLLKQALALAPRSVVVHRRYWDAINGSREMSADQKRQEIDRDASAFLKAHGDRPGALWAVASISREMKWTERQKACEEQILTGFPDDPAAEWVSAYRWRDIEPDEAGTLPPEFRALLQRFIARPQHYATPLLGEAYSNLFSVLARDESVPGDDLYRVGEGALKYEINSFVWADVPMWLAERKVHLADAERIAREGIDRRVKRLERDRGNDKAEQEYTRAVGSATSRNRDALGWALFGQGRFAEAEKELLAAYESEHEDRGILDHLGRFYLARQDEEKAEEYFVKGLAVQAPGPNPCETALRDLYEKRHGTRNGFDANLAALRDADRVKRHDKVLAERITAPEGVPSFDLKDLGGKRVSLESLKGRIVVINYWGIWCGWCVRELPDYQLVVEKYANDPDVAILTIDNDPNPDEVSAWMAQRKYTFPVLMDDQYVSDKAGIHAFPTTWFLDRQGRKAFEKVGWSEKLVEEFSWRIEALRGGQ